VVPIRDHLFQSLGEYKKLVEIKFFSSYKFCVVINHKTNYPLYILKFSVLASTKNLHNVIKNNDLNVLFSSIECELFVFN
jgi:hypothetical protein